MKRFMIFMGLFLATSALGAQLPIPRTIKGLYTFEAMASDPVVPNEVTSDAVSVQFLLNGSPIGPVILQGPTAPSYTYTWDSKTVPDGLYTIVAKATDAAGNFAISLPVMIDVRNIAPDTTPPTVTITMPTAAVVSGKTPIQVSASDASGIAKMELFLNNTLVWSQLNTTLLIYNWNTSPYKKVRNVSILARATDRTGLTTTQSRTVTVN